MGTGIRVEVKIDSPGDCPVAEASAETGTASYSISKAVDPKTGETITEEFMLDVEESDRSSIDGELDPVFQYGSQTVYQFQRDVDWGCPCEYVEAHDCPVVDIRTREGSLYLVFHASDMERLRAVVDDLREAYPNLDIQRLLRSKADQSGHNLVFVDRGQLTDRQREVLQTAHDMGYFDHPKRANASEVGEALGITQSTFSEHLAAAQRKLLTAILDQ